MLIYTASTSYSGISLIIASGCRLAFTSDCTLIWRAPFEHTAVADMSGTLLSFAERFAAPESDLSKRSARNVAERTSGSSGQEGGSLELNDLCGLLDATEDTASTKPAINPIPCVVPGCEGKLTAKFFSRGKPKYSCDGGCSPEAREAAIAALVAKKDSLQGPGGEELPPPSRPASPQKQSSNERTKQEPPRNPRPERQQEDPLRRLPPQNIEAEQAVLGAVFLDPEALATAKTILGRDDFYRETHREIFRAMEELASKGKPIDAITMVAALRTRQLLEQIGGPAYLAELADAVPTTAHQKHYAAIVRDMSVKRAVASISEDLSHMAYNGVSADALVGEFQRRANQLDKSAVGNVIAARPSLLSFAESKQLADEAESRPHIIQDFITVQDIFGVAAKKGIGKSTLLRQMAVAVSEGNDFLGLHTNQQRVWYLDLEPGNQQKRHEKFELLGWNPRSKNLVLSVCPPVAGEPWAFEWLEEEIVKNGFGLVIIDTLFKFCKVEQGNDYSSGLYGTAPLEGIVKRTKTSIGVAHHAPKNANPNSANVSAADLFLGAVSIAGSFGVCLAMRRQRGGPSGSRVSLFMDPPRYTKQVIEGEWLLDMDPISNEIRLGETVKKDWWNRIQVDVKFVAQGLKDEKGDPKPFIAGDILERLEGYKRPEIKRVLTYLEKNNYLECLGKESRRGGAIQYKVRTDAPVVEAPPRERQLWE